MLPFVAKCGWTAPGEGRVVGAAAKPSAVPSGAAGTAFGFIDLLKGGAAQLIVLHHLAFYGPMADYARPLAPELIDWLASQARIAVQVFLVIGGFLAAKSLSPRGKAGISRPLATILRRYIKLMPPFLMAILLAVAASAIARQWMTHASISPPPGLTDLVAHAFLLHSILGIESVSAGAWYVAIDFQLYAATVLLLWLSGRIAGERPAPWLMPALVLACASASLLHFNRHADWDPWAPYFFGSYGLGILAWWAGDRARRPAVTALLLAAMLAPALLALAVDFRSRIAIAFVAACALALLGRARLPVAGRGQAVINGLGRISYSVFLVHFSVSLVVNAAFIRFLSVQPLAQALGMLLAWAASLAAGLAFHRWIELPLNRLFTRAGRAHAGPLPAVG